MINKDFTYALIGASTNLEKYWNKIFQDLLQWWYKVIPINPNEKEILWTKVYSSLSDVDVLIDVVIFVVPPIITEKIVDEVISLWIKNVWMQPGSENDVSIKKCLDNWIKLVYNSCIMIKRKTDI